MALIDAVRPLERWEAVDGLSESLASKVKAVLSSRDRLKTLLSGTALGHPLHPMLTDVPIGAYTGAILLDLIGGDDQEAAADMLIGFGLISTVPTAMSGLADWSDTYGPEMRVGLVHAAANVAASTLFGLSLARRLSGHRRSGRLLALLGAGALGAGGWLGGHLAYSQAVGVDHDVFLELPSDWTDALEASALEEAKPVAAEVAGATVMLYRRGRHVYALADRCTHAGGPLHEGEVDEDLCVTCPWHQSRFRLADGGVERGPATSPQPLLETRVHGGRIQVRKAP